MIGKFHPGKKDPSGRVPFVVACEMNKLNVIRAFWRKYEKKPKVLTQKLKNWGLVAACEGATKLIVIQYLVNEMGCETDAENQNRTTALVALCRKSSGGGIMAETTPQVLAHRRCAASLLITKGASFEKMNLDGVVPLTCACENKNEKMAHMLVERGAELEPLMKWMNKSDHNAKNWCAGAIMSRWAWKDETFSGDMKKKFFEEFDKDGNGELDEDEFLHFMAFNMKLAFKRGMIPTKAFKDDGSLEVKQIEKLIKERASDLLAAHKRQTDRNHDGTYGWEELFPMVQDFYGNIWNSERPDDAGLDENYYGDDANDEMMRALYKDAKITKAPEPEKPLPEGWVAVEDPNTLDKQGKPRKYYHNAAMGKTTWKRSECFIEPDAKPEKVKPLPKTWSEVEDKASGRMYYYCSVTKATTWTRADCFK